MPRPGLKFNETTTGIGRPLPGKDHYSALGFYISDGHLPAGFSTTNRVNKVSSLAQAEALGIVNTNLNEVKATGTITITAVGATGDTISVFVTEYGNAANNFVPIIVSLGTYTKVSGDTTVTLVATALTAAINALTKTHGYTAISSVGAITITARAGLGIFLNSGTPLTTTIVGTITATTVQFSGGVASDIDQVHYHISEAFRILPQLVLYVGLFTPPGGSYSFTEAATLINYVPGDPRQIGFYTTTAYATANITALHTQLMTLANGGKQASGILTQDLTSVSLSTISDLSTLTDFRVTDDLSQDFGGQGYKLYKALGKTVGTVGAMTGCIALAKVSESIAWVAKFDVSDGTELETIGFGNGILWTDSTIQTGNLLDNLYDAQHQYLIKSINAPGTWYVDSNTAAPKSNTFCQIENMRTADKIVRGISTSAFPTVNGPLSLKPNGTLTEPQIAELERVVQIPMDQMIQAGEISVNDIQIDPTQVVSSSSTVNITVDVVAIGVGRHLVFNINETNALPTT